MWLMARGHLVGYQFSGLNNEARNLVPETAWFNGGNFTGTNDGNTASMLYYENRLDSWLANHPNYYLDYQVTPLYEGNELCLDKFVWLMLELIKMVKPCLSNSVVVVKSQEWWSNCRCS